MQIKCLYNLFHIEIKTHLKYFIDFFFHLVLPLKTFPQISRISSSPMVRSPPSVRVIITPGSPLSPF